MFPSKIKQFLKDYRIPATATAVFLLILTAIFLIRAYELSVLASALPKSTSAEKDYASLLSADKPEDFQKNEVTDEPSEQDTSNQEPSTSTTGGDSSTFTDTTVSSGGDSGGGSSGGGEEDPPDEEDPPVETPPFSATVIRVYRDSAGNGLPTSCSGAVCNYALSFGSEISTTNGPGDVKYRWGWAYKTATGFSDGSFSAPSGSATTNVNKTVPVTCNIGERFELTVGIMTTQPTPTSAKTIVYPIGCGTAL